MLPENREDRTVLPIEVPSVDVHSLLSKLQFNPAEFSSQENYLGVSGTYLGAVLFSYAELGGAENILGKVIAATVNVEDTPTLHRLLTRKMIPWPLYELVAEEARLSLVNAGKPVGSIDRAYSSFLWGVGGIISVPSLVAATAILPLESIIDTINKYNTKMNKVTAMELTERPHVEGNVVSVTLKRTQTPESIQSLDEMLGQTSASDNERQAVIHAICSRDLATTLGTFVGVTLLGGRPAEHIVVTGDPAGQTEIQVYYAGVGNNILHCLGQVFLDASGLALYNNFGLARRARDRTVGRSMRHAIYALDKAQLQRVSQERERLAVEKARLEFLKSVGDINQRYALARGIIHDIKNFALGMQAKAYAYAREFSALFEGYALDGSGESLNNTLETMIQRTDLPPQLYQTLQYVNETLETAQGILAAAGTGMHGQINPIKKEVGYKQIILEALSMIRPIYEKRVDITVDCPDEVTVEVDPQYFSAAIKNVIDNAAAASVVEGQVGKVHIEVETLKRTRATYIITTITQSGYMTEDIETRLNTGESFTTKKDGNGIGASASHGIIIGMHAGSIKYESLEKEGATVTIKLSK